MKNWWNGYPWRMIQTNLREIDMEDIDADVYVDELKSFNASVVLLNAAGIIASYETALEFQPRSKYLHGDNLKKIIDACHNAGIRVQARMDFSKIRYEIYEQHPEWVYRNINGEICNYNGDVQTCVNGDYQQQYIFEIMKEVLTTHDFDGIFCNMGGFRVVDYSGKYYGLCHCESCRRKFMERFGINLPEKENINDPVYQKYMTFKSDCEREHKVKIYDAVKAINPKIAVNGFDLIRCESGTGIGETQWQYSSSSNSRVISGTERKRPSDNSSCDFMGFRYRNNSVSPALLELRQWQNLANSGCLSMYIMGTIGNHADKSGYEGIKKVFSFHKKHEDFFQGLVSASKVVVMRKGMWEVDHEVYGFIRALTESHIPFDEMFFEEFCSLSQVKGKDIMVLGNMKYISDEKAALIDAFAANGGTVIATGETALYNDRYEKRDNVALSCLGVKCVKTVRHDLMSSIFLISDDEKKKFPHCHDMPYIAPGEDMVFTEPEKSVNKYLKLIPEHPFGPPERCYFTEVTEHPGITVFQYEKGGGVYIPWMIGSFYRNEGYYNTLSIIQDIMFSLCGIQKIAPELTPMVEISLYKKEDKTVIQLVNNSGCFANSYFPPVPIQNIRIQLKDLKCINDISALNGGIVSYCECCGFIEIILNELMNYEAIVIS